MRKALDIAHIVSQWVFGILIGLVLAYLAVMVGHSAVDANDAHGHLSKPVASCPQEDSCEYSAALNQWVPVLH